jgi:hypothetical protein
MTFGRDVKDQYKQRKSKKGGIGGAAGMKAVAVSGETLLHNSALLCLPFADQLRPG